MGRSTKQCTVLFVNPDGRQSAHPAYLREAGFVVKEAADWPEGGQNVRDYHAIVVGLRAVGAAPMLAARLRAKPHVDQLVLAALVAPDTSLPDRRAALAGGFDIVLNQCCDSRELAVSLLRTLRRRPELRCALPPPLRRSSAA